MTEPIVLASRSATRRAMLTAAGVPLEVVSASVDEDLIKAAMLAEDAPPRDIADALAEAKARKGSGKRPDALVIGADQVLVCDGQILSKPTSPDATMEQLRFLSGKEHRLISAVVVYLGGEPQWRHVDVARLTMRRLSEAYLQGYVTRNWQEVRHSVGGYQIETEGIRLFESVKGSHFTILGLPMVELLGYLTLRGAIDG
jgi:septum formation protein